MIPGLKDWEERFNTLVASIDRLTDATLRSFPANSQIPAPASEWEPFVLVDGGTTDGSGNLTVTCGQPVASNGWEGYVGRVAVTVQGASSAATVANYHGSAADGNLFDFAGAMIGSSPSRIVADYNTPVYFRDGQHVTVVVTGAVASSGVIVRVEGRRRPVGGSVPA